MARIRRVEVRHFRRIRELTWCPASGINCLIGPGDSGKSSILEAIDLCLGARRNPQFTDVDFHLLDVSTPIIVSVTLGDLDDALRNLDAYGLYLRGIDPLTGNLEDEPGKGLETALTVRLVVGADLEPVWSLVSERAEASGSTRNLSWSDRLRLAPTWVGASADHHLAWRRGSILNRVSDERPDAGAALAKAFREARATFGSHAQAELADTLARVTATARNLGIPVGDSAQALLDANSVSFTGGTIALHDEDGVPLRGLGTGSTRLLVAGLQGVVAGRSSVLLLDEVEHGLEPHRILRLLHSLGSKEPSPPLQAFMATHSPVVLRELTGHQLFVVRPGAATHSVLPVGTTDDIQGTIRLFPEAFLAPSVLVCEGASEVGLVRGVDQHRVEHGGVSVAAHGVALVDSHGGGPDEPFERANAFLTLGYRVAVLRDDDKNPTPSVESDFVAAGGRVVAWRDGRALEDELFLSLPQDAVGALLEHAVEVHGPELVDAHIKTASANGMNLHTVRAALPGGLTQQVRTVLGHASKTKRHGWFKSVTRMEHVARKIAGPSLDLADDGFKKLIDELFAWATDAAG